MTQPGRFFEDFTVGQMIRHATPRTVTTGDQALYMALYGSRFALQSSDLFAQRHRLSARPARRSAGVQRGVRQDRARHLAQCGGQSRLCRARFVKAVFPGDTITAESEVIGLKETTSGQTGIVYVSSRGFNQDGEAVLEFIRWVMVKKRDEPRRRLICKSMGRWCPNCRPRSRRTCWGGPCCRSTCMAGRAPVGQPPALAHYEVGERIDHVDGMTVEEAEHMMATRLYQNPARVHFNQHAESHGRFGRRIVYGGHVISWPGRSASTGWPTPFISPPSTPGGTLRRCSPAAPSMPGRRSWTPRNCPTAPISGRCAWSPPPPSTVPATTSPAARATNSPRASSSNSTTGFCCRVEPWLDSRPR
jgi:2-methylfumaryl-CoA hydratase